MKPCVDRTPITEWGEPLSQVICACTSTSMDYVVGVILPTYDGRQGKIFMYMKGRGALGSTAYPGVPGHWHRYNPAPG